MRHSLLAGLAASLIAALVPALAFAEPPNLDRPPAAVATFDSGILHVEQFGHGAPVVLIPGLTCGTWEWYGTIEHLAPTHTVYAITLSGFDGRAPVDGPLFPKVTADFWTMLDTHHIVKPLLIGHSLGGTISILLGEQHPERLRAIVALDGLPVLPRTESVTGAARGVLAVQVSAQMSAATHDQFLAYERSYMQTAGGVIDPATAERVAVLEAKSDPKATAMYLSEDIAGDLRPDLPKITVPLLELSPYLASDFATAQLNITEPQKTAYYQALLAGTPHVTVQSISPSRHFAMFDATAVLYQRIDAFEATLSP